MFSVHSLEMHLPYETFNNQVHLSAFSSRANKAVQKYAYLHSDMAFQSWHSRFVLQNKNAFLDDNEMPLGIRVISKQ